MHRTPRTLLLSVVALGSLATAAAATPSTTMPFGDQMAGMHAGDGHGAGMHSMMMADPSHASLLDDPAMQAHMADYGVDVDQMRTWHDQGASVETMHETLAEQGIDVEAMQADCPMLAGSMASMHGTGDDHQRHHD